MAFKHFFLTLLFLLSLSCNFNDKPDNNLNKRNRNIDNDTVFRYYNNGKIKSKGLLKKDRNIGWWTYYDSLGKKSKQIEYLLINDSIYKNQKIIFNEDLEINYSDSNFFEVIIDDTLSLGKNIGIVNYFSNQKEFNLQNVFVIIDNEYEKGFIKRDTFIESPSRSRFGVFGLNSGTKFIKGTILEQLAYKNKVSKDTFELKILNIKRYFTKEVYIKGNSVPE